MIPRSGVAAERLVPVLPGLLPFRDRGVPRVAVLLTFIVLVPLAARRLGAAAPLPPPFAFALRSVPIAPRLVVPRPVLVVLASRTAPDLRAGALVGSAVALLDFVAGAFAGRAAAARVTFVAGSRRRAPRVGAEVGWGVAIGSGAGDAGTFADGTGFLFGLTRDTWAPYVTLRT